MMEELRESSYFPEALYKSRESLKNAPKFIILDRNIKNFSSLRQRSNALTRTNSYNDRNLKVLNKI